MSTPATRSRRRREPASQSEPKPTQTTAAKPRDGFWCIANSSNEIRPVKDVAALRTAMAAGDKVWIDLVSPDRDQLIKLAAVLDLHPLIAEDILERNQRAKYDQYSNAAHIVMFALSYEGEIVSHELDIVLGQRYLLTSHEADVDLRNAPFMKREEGVHLKGGPDFVLWAVSDWIVDGYFPVFDRLGDEIDDLEADVMRRPNQWVVERLFQIRRDLLAIRHSVQPQREIFNQLTNRDSKLIETDRIVYFRDVYDHLIRLTDELDNYRELVSTTLDIYLSQVNNNLSEIMKRLTGVTVILATIGAIGGIFGMSEAGSAFNFTESWGFWLVTLVAIGLAAATYLYFRRRNWI
jgi:magnesium transporter